jgi:D-proline reductase (dithiol) PrdB
MIFVVTVLQSFRMGWRMINLNRLKNKGIARLAHSIPAFAEFLTAFYTPPESGDIPWTPIKKPLHKSKIALVTTAGIHHVDQKPFSMKDSTGDSTYRMIDAETIAEDYVITHDYYDHRDADKDLNIIFPVTRLKEMTAKGIVGSIARYHFSFMGHIKGAHLDSLLEKYAPEMASRFVQDHVDAVLLTPG